MNLWYTVNVIEQPCCQCHWHIEASFGNKHVHRILIEMVLVIVIESRQFLIVQNRNWLETPVPGKFSRYFHSPNSAAVPYFIEKYKYLFDKEHEGWYNCFVCRHFGKKPIFRFSNKWIFAHISMHYSFPRWRGSRWEVYWESTTRLSEPSSTRIIIITNGNNWSQRRRFRYHRQVKLIINRFWIKRSSELHIILFENTIF